MHDAHPHQREIAALERLAREASRLADCVIRVDQLVAIGCYKEAVATRTEMQEAACGAIEAAQECGTNDSTIVGEAYAICEQMLDMISEAVQQNNRALLERASLLARARVLDAA